MHQSSYQGLFLGSGILAFLQFFFFLLLLGLTALSGTFSRILNCGGDKWAALSDF